MLIQADQSLLLIIDIQDRLLPAVCRPDELLKQARWLLEVANHLEVPVLVSEQYPQGLGGTSSTLSELVEPGQLVAKEYFSCADEPACVDAIRQQQRKQIVICGMEAHVCVLQSAIGLLQQGFEVFVAADLISSRSESDRQLAIDRMRAEGIQIVSREMVAFEWMQRCNTESFRHISKNYLR